MTSLQGTRSTIAAALAIALTLLAPTAGRAAGIVEAVGITPALVAAAEKDGEVDLQYNYQLDQMQAIVAAFNKDYPSVKVVAERRPGAPGAFALEQELGSGINRIDVFQGTDLAANQDLVKKNAFAALRPADINDFPKRALPMAPYLYYPEEVIAVVAYNPQFVTPAEAKMLHQWRGILDPRFKNRISLVTPALGVTQGVLNYVMNTPSLGVDFLTKLKAQNPNIYPNAVPARDAAVSGQKPIIWGAVWDALAIQDVASGSPLRFAFTDPSVLMIGAGWGVLAKAPHPNAARLFWAWILSKDGAKAIEGPDSNMHSILSGVKDQRPAQQVVLKTAWYQPPTVLWSPDVQNWIDNGPKYRAEWESIFQK
jgi:ABC-type Fe3+ transport system substrate-binding protein